METVNLDIPREDDMEEDVNRTPDQHDEEQAGGEDVNQSAPNQQLLALTPAIQQLLEQNNPQLRGQLQFIVTTSKGQNQLVPVLLTNHGANGTNHGEATGYEEQQDPNSHAQAIPFQGGITYQTIDDRSNPAVLFCRDVALMDQAHIQNKEIFDKGSKLIQRLVEVLDELEKPAGMLDAVDNLKKNAEEFKELLYMSGMNTEKKEWLQRRGVEQILPRPAGRTPINDLRNSTQKNKALRKILNPVESALIRYEKINLLTALRELPEFATTFQMMMMQPGVSDFQQEQHTLMQAQEAMYGNTNMTDEQAAQAQQDQLDPANTFVDVGGKKRSISELTSEEINEITKRLKVNTGDIVTGSADQLPSIGDHDQSNGQDPNGGDVDSQVLNLSSLTYPLYVMPGQYADQGDGTGPNTNMLEDEGSRSDSEHHELNTSEDGRRGSKGGSRSRFPQNTKEEWGFDADDVKREYEAYLADAANEAADSKKAGLKWAKISKKLGNTKFLELGDCGPKVKAILRRKYPEIIGEKVKIPTDPKTEWGFSADDIKAKIEELSNIAGVTPGSPHKSISMSKIGALLGTAKPKNDKLRPIAERKDRGQLVHALLKSKYPDLAAKFQRQGRKTK